MKRLRSIGRTLKTLAGTAVCWAAVHGTALAQARPQDEEEEGGASWTMSYLLVLFGVGLGMLLVCRSSRRRERARPETYVETKSVMDAD
jgi:heme/copper-type cytochrome/quinol oxidase subunit 2